MLKKISEKYLAWRQRREATAKVDMFLDGVFWRVAGDVIRPQMEGTGPWGLDVRVFIEFSGHKIRGVLVHVARLIWNKWEWSELTIDNVDVRQSSVARRLASALGVLVLRKREREAAKEKQCVQDRINELAKTL